MNLPEQERVLDVMQSGSLLLSRVERHEDGVRPGQTAIRLRLLNLGTQAITVDYVTFQHAALNVTLPFNRRVEPARYLNVVDPQTADAVTLQASRQGQSALFRAGVPFEMIVAVTTPYGPVTLTQQITWGFWIEGGYGFTLLDDAR
jgi:hypothetical protein